MARSRGRKERADGAGAGRRGAGAGPRVGWEGVRPREGRETPRAHRDGDGGTPPPWMTVPELLAEVGAALQRRRKALGDRTRDVATATAFRTLLEGSAAGGTGGGRDGDGPGHGLPPGAVRLLREIEQLRLETGAAREAPRSPETQSGEITAAHAAKLET
jgi:hypothetical protein